MDKHEKRRVALRALVDSLGRGGISAVASRIGKEPNYVSRMLYPPGKEGRKRIGEDSVDALALAYPEWFRGIDYGEHHPNDDSCKKSDIPIQTCNSNIIIDRYHAADDATRAAVDLILLHKGERELLSDGLRLAIKMLEDGAKEALLEIKNLERKGYSSAAEAA